MKQETYGLRLERGHLFASLPGGDALVDTGAPRSVGYEPTVTVADFTVPLARHYMGVTVKRLRKYVGVNFSCLLGMDVLRRLDAVFDLPAGTVTFSQQSDLAVVGHTAGMRLNGVPMFTGWVRGLPRPWVFDSGAQLSYYLPVDDDLSLLPYAGKARDFFPLLGEYEVDTYRVPVTLGESQLEVKLRAAVPAKLLRRVLARWGGLVGSELFVGRQVGFFPLRQTLVVGE